MRVSLNVRIVQCVDFDLNEKYQSSFLREESNLAPDFLKINSKHAYVLIRILLFGKIIVSERKKNYSLGLALESL